MAERRRAQEMALTKTWERARKDERGGEDGIAVMCAFGEGGGCVCACTEVQKGGLDVESGG
jgi:hypothetical protein